MRLTLSKKISLLLIFTGLVTLANVLIVVRYHTFQINSAKIANTARSQGMLLETISKLTVSVANGSDSDRPLLIRMVQRYDLTVDELGAGLAVMEKSGRTPISTINELYRRHNDLWDSVKKKAMLAVKEPRHNASFSAAVAYVKTRNERLLKLSNDVVSTYESFSDAFKYAHEINISGLQRMLSQEMTKYALTIEKGIDIDREKLQEAIRLYDRILLVLWDGGVLEPWNKELGPAPFKVRKRIDNLEKDWEPFRKRLKVIQSGPRDNKVFKASIDYVRLNYPYLKELHKKIEDSLVTVFGKKDVEWKLFLTLLLILESCVLLAGYFMAENLAWYIRNLSRCAVKISEGDFAQKVSIPGQKDEIRDLALAFQRMCLNLEKTTVSKDYVSTIVNTMIDTLVVVSLDGKIEAVNNSLCKLLGYTEGELIGKSVNVISPEKSSMCKKTLLDEIYRKGYLSAQEISYKSANGDIIPMLFSVAALRNKDGKLTGTVWAAQEITERKQVEEKIMEAVDIKSKFISTVSHELRTPLTPITEGINLILDGYSGELNAGQRELLEIAKRNIDRLVRIINSILDFSKVTSEKVEKRRGLCNLNRLIATVVDSYKVVAERKKLYIYTMLKATEDLTLELDADSMEQVLINLINNAIRFTDNGGITVFTGKNDNNDFVVIGVKDAGIGIRDTDKPKLFHTFSQFGERRVGGTGLGLAICKEIVERSGGRIWVESEFGKGSAFFFTLSAEIAVAVEV